MGEIIYPFLPQETYRQLCDGFLDPSIILAARQKYGDIQVATAITNGFRAFMTEENLGDVMRDGTGNRLKLGVSPLYENILLQSTADPTARLDLYVQALKGSGLLPGTSPSIIDSLASSLKILRSTNKGSAEQ